MNRGIRPSVFRPLIVAMHARHPTSEPASAACGVAVHALVEATLPEIAGLRTAPVPEGAPPLPPRFLRHCDEQTVVGMRAVLEAIAAHPAPCPSFADYGVVAAPCRSGRIAAAQTLAALRTGGAATVSPHVVPQCSLHSIAGAVSVALGMHGPNVGISGGQAAMSEGLFACLTLLCEGGAADAQGIPGIWLVLSGWDVEPVLDAGGQPMAAESGPEPKCRGLAVALTSAEAASLRLTMHMPSGQRAVTPPAPGDDLIAFARALDAQAGTGSDVSWSHTCPWGAEVRLASSMANDRVARPSHRREAA